TKGLEWPAIARLGWLLLTTRKKSSSGQPPPRVVRETLSSVAPQRRTRFNACGYNVGQHPTTSQNDFEKCPRLEYPTANAASVPLCRPPRNNSAARSIRIRRRNCGIVIPISCEKVRER